MKSNTSPDFFWYPFYREKYVFDFCSGCIDCHTDKRCHAPVELNVFPRGNPSLRVLRRAVCTVCCFSVISGIPEWMLQAPCHVGRASAVVERCIRRKVEPLLPVRLLACLPAYRMHGMGVTRVDVGAGGSRQTLSEVGALGPWSFFPSSLLSPHLQLSIKHRPSTKPESGE